MTHVIVIGGGAAGCMAALSAAQKGASVTLMERNQKLGRKLYITGKGRCNVTNDSPAAEVLQNIPHNSRFLTSAVTRFPPEAVKAFEEKAHSVTRAQRRRLLETLKCLRVDIRGPRPVEEAIVTSGGVKVSEINPSTMESKLAPGVYFAGEVLDADAYTGGFNLQIAWSTGRAAGEAAALFCTEHRGGMEP